jgi:hypothetical protein
VISTHGQYDDNLYLDMTYAAGSWRKLKSFDGMSSIPLEAPSCGDSARDGARAGDLTREGRVDGERFDVVLADSGLYCNVSAVSHPS